MKRDGSYFKGATAGLIAMLEARSLETGEQCPRVARIALALGRHMGLSGKELRDLQFGAMLHDIGKVVVPAAVLGKPGKLTEEEWEKVRPHPVVGHDILLSLGFPLRIALIAGQHHERYDGTGYPDRLTATHISQLARLFALADTYDAITSDRCWRKGRTHTVAIEELTTNAGKQFDPAIVEAFLELTPAQLLDVDAVTWN